jgi:raffinose/stachyose/melibiose transport system permease protein
MLFMVFPTVGGLFYSFTNWNALYPNFKFIWFDNFIEALGDKNFTNSIFFSVKYVIAMVIIQNVLGLLFAVLIDSRKRQGILRTIFFMPNMISLITSSFIWAFIFMKVFPEAAKIFIFKYFDQDWLGNANFAFWAIIIVAIWAGVGYTTIIYLAALQGVDKSLHEAASIDGANKWQRFTNVTIPMIMHAVAINVFLTLNGSFKAFDHVYGMTNGGPGRATEVIALNIYKEAFSSNFRFGYANAKAIILFLLIFAITMIQLNVMKGKSEK